MIHGNIFLFGMHAEIFEALPYLLVLASSGAVQPVYELHVAFQYLSERGQHFFFFLIPLIPQLLK